MANVILVCKHTLTFAEMMKRLCAIQLHNFQNFQSSICNQFEIRIFGFDASLSTKKPMSMSVTECTDVQCVNFKSNVLEHDASVKLLDEVWNFLQATVIQDRYSDLLNWLK